MAFSFGTQGQFCQACGAEKHVKVRVKQFNATSTRWQPWTEAQNDAYSENIELVAIACPQCRIRYEIDEFV